MNGMQGSVADLVRQAGALFQAGRLDEADRAYRQVLAVLPSHVQSLQMLGLINAQRGRLQEAEACMQAAIAADPTSATAHADLGSVRNLLGRHEDALASLAQALRLRPAWCEALANRAAVETALGRNEDALVSCDLALRHNPLWPEAWNNRGVALMGLARFAEAGVDFDRALELRPDSPRYRDNRAASLRAQMRLKEALAACDEALARAPRYVDALVTRGVVLHELARHEEAVQSFDHALALQPDHPRALQNRGVALSYMRRHREAVRDLRRAAALQPDLPFIDGSLLRSQLQLCDWSDLDQRRARIVAAVRAGIPACDPFTFLAIARDPADALANSRVWARKYPVTPIPADRRSNTRDRIRIAYLSADFHEHATAYLLAEVLEQHDRTRFEVAAVSWGPGDESAMRARLVAATDVFRDARDESHEATAAWLAEWQADIAIDLKGYTFDARPAILAHRAAPVQVSFLGYPGTLAAPWTDYLIADATVIPPGEERHYAEAVVRMPDSYQPNDRQRRIADESPSRRQLGLPDVGFVFCCFNNTYKLMPEQFGCWMRLLHAVDGSVLWLLEGHPEATVNLRRAAEALGIAGDRLVFAPRVPASEHLARYRRADLFLDALPYNAHTTASDALWAGLPVLTCLGGTFAGRVAGSLVRAAGLPELAVATPGQYEAVAVQLAREPGTLASLRQRLADHRMTCALFDSERYTRHLEAAYATMHGRAQRGEAPAAFAVPRIVADR